MDYQKADKFGYKKDEDWIDKKRYLEAKNSEEEKKENSTLEIARKYEKLLIW